MAISLVAVATAQGMESRRRETLRKTRSCEMKGNPSRGAAAVKAKEKNNRLADRDRLAFVFCYVSRVPIVIERACFLDDEPTVPSTV